MRLLMGGPPPAWMKVIAEIGKERFRQIEGEGHGSTHDDLYRGGQLAQAAGTYAFNAASQMPERCGNVRAHVELAARRFWPWSHESYKPKDPRRDLIRAGAFIVAEIERLDRRYGRDG